MHMSHNIQAIIFDFGGVLLDWDPRNLYRRYFDQPEQLERFLSEINFAEWNMMQDKGRPFAEAVAELSARFPQYAELIRAYPEHWEESITGPIQGAVAILRQLKEAGNRLYALSNWSSETFPIAYKKYDFFRLFDEIILSGAVKMVKPDPKIFELALRKIGRPAPECLLIDDSLANILAAKQMGFVTIHFQSPEQLASDLQKLGCLGPVRVRR